MGLTKFVNNNWFTLFSPRMQTSIKYILAGDSCSIDLEAAACVVVQRQTKGADGLMGGPVGSGVGSPHNAY